MHILDRTRATETRINVIIEQILKMGSFEKYMKTDDFRGLPFEEKSLVMGCYYLECFKIKKTLPERVVTEAKKALINSASEFSEKIEKQRHFSEKQISMIMPTDAMRVELHKAINNSEDVTEKALKLLDAYSGDTFTKSYERVKNQNESK